MADVRSRLSVKGLKAARVNPRISRASNIITKVAGLHKSLPLSESSRLVKSKDERQYTTRRDDVDTVDPLDHKAAGIGQKTNGANAATKEETKPEEKSGFKILRTLSGRRKYTLLFIASASFLAGVTFSLIGPIYPIEATKKGMGNTLIGFVFGLFGVVIFATAPIFGNYLTKLGPKFTFLTGIFVGGACNLLFGTLYYCPSGTPFIVLSILVRCTEAIGFSAYITASFAIISSEFKENIGFTFGILETGNGLGFMLGPTIGGALYELGGFGLPFYVAGGLVILNGIVAYRFLPVMEEVEKKRKRSMWSLFRNPMVVVPLGSLFIGQMGMTTYYSTLAKHTAPLGLSVGFIGLLFGGGAFLYSGTSVVWGYVSDTLDIQAPLIIGGQLTFGIGLLIIGPSVLFPFLDLSLASLCVGLVCLGMTFGCIFIPTMKCMVMGAVEQGFGNNIDTFALVSGLFNAAHTFGGFVGPVGMGAMVEEYGYRVTYTVVGLANIGWVVVCVVHFSLRRHWKKKGFYQNMDDDDGEETKGKFEVPYGRCRSLSLPSGSV